MHLVVQLLVVLVFPKLINKLCKMAFLTDVAVQYKKPKLSNKK